MYSLYRESLSPLVPQTIIYNIFCFLKKSPFIGGHLFHPLPLSPKPALGKLFLKMPIPLVPPYLQPHHHHPCKPPCTLPPYPHTYPPILTHPPPINAPTTPTNTPNRTNHTNTPNPTNLLPLATRSPHNTCAWVRPGSPAAPHTLFLAAFSACVACGVRIKGYTTPRNSAQIARFCVFFSFSLTFEIVSQTFAILKDNLSFCFVSRSFFAVFLARAKSYTAKIHIFVPVCVSAFGIYMSAMFPTLIFEICKVIQANGTACRASCAGMRQRRGVWVRRRALAR